MTVAQLKEELLHDNKQTTTTVTPVSTPPSVVRKRAPAKPRNPSTARTPGAGRGSRSGGGARGGGRGRGAMHNTPLTNTVSPQLQATPNAPKPVLQYASRQPQPQQQVQVQSPQQQPNMMQHKLIQQQNAVRMQQVTELEGSFISLCSWCVSKACTSELD